MAWDRSELLPVEIAGWCECVLGGCEGADSGGRAAHGEQRDDIGGLQRRIGPIGEIQLVQRPRKADVHRDAAHLCGQVHVDHRLNLGRIVEIDFAAIDAVLVAEELDLTGVDGDVAQQNGTIGGAAQTQVGIGLDVPGERRFHFEVAALATRTSN